MRVIAGNLGGRRLAAPKGMSTRPTIDRVKEAIFSTITPFLPGARVLDAFSGTGSLAIEALSRGAKEAVLIEKDLKAYKIIKQNIENLSVSGSKEIFGDCLKVILRMNDDEKFDLIFLDPPYNKGFLDKAIKVIMEKDILNKEGIIIIETNSRNNEAFDMFELEVLKKADYGDTSIIYCKNAERSTNSGES